MQKEYMFLQISDLHFGKESIYGNYDMDSDLRNEMINDMIKMKNKYSFNIDGVLICGDIAFSGKKSEYVIAEEFIEKIREKLDVEMEKVFCVPGNHDVDQSTVKNRLAIYALQKLLENANVVNLSHYLGQMFGNADGVNNDAQLLYEPIAAYNDFADKHSARLNIKNPYIDYEFELDEGYQLIIHSMNSTLVSNSEDHNWKNHTEKKMIIDTNQIPKSSPKKIYMTLCHHPVEYWKDDEDILKEKLNKRAKIQLFGHTHEQSIYLENEYVRLISGAL